MKNLINALDILLAICLLSVSCTKNEDSIASIEPADTNVYTITNLPPATIATIPSNPIISSDPGGPDVPPSPPFTVIENPTAAYISETCLFDISKMAFDSIYHQVNNKNLNIAFFKDDEPRMEGNEISYARRLSNTPGSSTGWPELWNHFPCVEKERPDVLFCWGGYGGSNMTIIFSKPCIEFGVEISPNIQQPAHFYYANFENYRYLFQMLKTPAGARLFAIKSTKPFTSVFIAFDLNGWPDYDHLPNGFALANIRYKLAK